MSDREIPLVLTDTPFKTAYGLHERVQLDTGDASNVKQSFKDEVDVNNIIVRFKATGVLPDAASVPPRFFDVSEMPSFQSALEHVRSVTEFFEALPAATRAEFGNDPAFFADWVTDPANEAEVKAYGLASADSSIGGAGGGAGGAVEAEAASEGSATSAEG